MLTVFFGNDTITIRSEAFALAEKFADTPDSVVRFDADNFNAAMVSEAVQTTSLFGGKQVFLIDTISDDVEQFEELCALLPTLAHSEHECILIEKVLLADVRKQCVAVNATLHEYKRVEEKGFDIFSLTTALLQRDKKSLWLALQDARQAGISAEEIIGTLVWQIKTMRLVSRTSSPEEADLKPFVFNKTKQALGRFTSTEIDEYSRALLTLYHEGHRGIKNIDLALEGWVLGL